MWNSLGKNSRIVVVAIAGVALAGSWWWLSSERYISGAKTAVRDRFEDPESAQFRNVFIGDDKVVCGEVNVKNRLGGYVGFRDFLVKDALTKDAYALIRPTEDELANEKRMNEVEVSLGRKQSRGDQFSAMAYETMGRTCIVMKNHRS